MIAASQKRNVIPALRGHRRLPPPPRSVAGGRRAPIVARCSATGDTTSSGSRPRAARARRWSPRSGTPSSPLSPRSSPRRAVAPICLPASPTATGCARPSGPSPTASSPCATMDPEVAARFVHSADERIELDDLELGVRFLRYAAQADRLLACPPMTEEDPARRDGARERRARARADRVGVRGPASRRDAAQARRTASASAPRAWSSPLLRGPARLPRSSLCCPRGAPSRCPRRGCRSSARGGRARWSRARCRGRVAAIARSAPAAKELARGLASLAPAVRCAARRPRRLPRRRAHLDRHLRARRAAREGARALRLASCRPAARHAGDRELARRARRRHLRGARARASLGAVAASTEIFGWMVRHPEHPLTKRARQARATSSSTGSRRPSPRPSSSRWRRPPSRACLE